MPPSEGNISNLDHVTNSQSQEIQSLPDPLPVGTTKAGQQVSKGVTDTVAQQIDDEPRGPTKPGKDFKPDLLDSATSKVRGLSISDEKDHLQHPVKSSTTRGAGYVDPEKQALAAQDQDLINTSNNRQKQPPSPPPKDSHFLDSGSRTRETPVPVSPSRSHLGLNEDENEKKAYSRSPDGSSFMDQLASTAEGKNREAVDTDSKAEIQSIMDQFDEYEESPDKDEATSSRLEVVNSHTRQHPPRRSSLEPIRLSTVEMNSQKAHADLNPSNDVPPAVPSKSSPIVATRTGSSGITSPTFETPSSPPSLHDLHKPPPPEPDPESDLPFDFHRFLEQLRHRSADPVAGFLRSFLSEFSRKQWMVHEQVKIISDFLDFITAKMEQCEVWKGVSDAEFDNAKEGMEKLVMNRLYSQTFSPAIPASQLQPPSKGKRKQPDRPPSGRKGQHQEDVERDDVLAQKVQIYGWVQEKHLDIPPIGAGSRKFLVLAQQELLKINGYRAPRDKIICVLNSCKVIFGLLKRAGSDSSADSFIPLLILIVLQANPEHLVSNVQYILRFRNQYKLAGEAGYYLSSLMGAVQFIETLDRTNLTVSDSEFEKNVEESVSAIAEKHVVPEETPRNPPRNSSSGPKPISEKSTLSNPQVTPRNSSDAERVSMRKKSPTRRKGADGAASPESSSDDAVSGLLRTIQKPLSSIGRMFTDDGDAPSPNSRQRPTPNQSRGTSESRKSADRTREGAGRNASASAQQGAQALNSREAAARQASAESVQAERIQRAEHKNVVETLTAMFPNLDKDVIDDVVRMNEGRVGSAVDACLALSSTG